MLVEEVCTNTIVLRHEVFEQCCLDTESECWLVIGITLPENRKVGSFLLNIDLCFLIETKFISKMFKKFRRQNESQEIPRLRLFIFSWKISRISLKIIKIIQKNENSRLLIMYSNPCGSGIWDLALIPHKSSDYYILFFLHGSIKIGPTVANQYS